MRRSLLLIAAAFAAGVGVGYILQPGVPSGRAGPAARTAAEGATAPPAAAAPERGDTHLPSAPVPALPSGDGRIRGHARDGGGAPLADVLVVANTYRSVSQKRAKGAAAPRDPDLETVGRAAIARERWQREARRTARTAADGSYELTGLAPVKWRIEAYKEGYELEATPPGRNVVDPGAAVDFAGSVIVRIDVDVRLPDGSRPERAQILAEQQTGGSRATVSELWLPDEPWIELKPETYELRATATDARSEPQTVNVEAGSTPPLSFRLESRPGLRLKVLPPEGFEPLYCEVFAIRFTGAEPPDMDRLRTEGMRNHVDPHETRATWHDLTPGSYLVGAAFGTGATFGAVPVAVTKVVHVGDRTEEHELRLPPLDPREFIVARARGPDGGALRDVTFGLFLRGERGGARHLAMSTARRTDGATCLRRPAEGWIGAGERLFVLAHERSLGHVERPCEPDAAEVVLAFDRPAHVEVTLAGYAASPHAGWLGMTLAPRDDIRSGYARVGEGGRMRFGPVQPGAYAVVVTAIVDAQSSLRAAGIPVDLGPGEKAISIDIPPLHALAVRWPGEGANRALRIAPKGGREEPIVRTMREERTTFERLPAGRYEMRATDGSGDRIMEIDVPAQTEVTIR